ncbi:uncharacterized protein N7459_000275 [Penicillium hispanicum]|uniref:uncharacterized protein n=1 Tax=Penicillium hispanicum TaxID=1080232 RepID=UPI00254121B3|nr:uncharacterized protein N7459_000275 [Penicillium hispanicum]KAJ5594067.1 hypothetical protein N7459_000275 [Penicillium hispanicum]
MMKQVVNWAMAALRWAQISAYDYGHHSHYLSPEKVEDFRKSFLAVQILYFANSVVTKASLLLLYYRIFGVVKTFCWALWITGSLVITYFVTCTIVSIAGCHPVSKFWDEQLPGTCIDEVAFFRWNGVGNMLLDALILCLPYPIAWRLQTSLRQKLFFTGIFLLGGL